MTDYDRPLELDWKDLPEDKPREKIVIDLEDLPEDDAPQGRVYPGMPPGAIYQQPAQNKTGNAIVRSNVMQNLLAGLIGGLVAWILTELLYADYRTVQNATQIVLEMGALFGVIGGLIGAALGAAEGIVTRVPPAAWRGGGIGLGIGLAGGFLGGVTGQFIYSALGGGGGVSMGQQVLARSLGWGLVGLFTGLGQGVAYRSGKKIINGLIGGLIGGVVGGLLFDLVAGLSGGGGASRMIAITLMGGCIGAAIGMVDEIRKEAWLKVIAGPMAGKEYILFKDVTLLGSSPKCDIVIYRDPLVALQQATIQGTRGRYSIINNSSSNQVYVNDRPVSSTGLVNGQSIRMGSTVFLFQLRANTQQS